ncbi:hypothetical protein [Lacinutrix salivirga]
MKTLLILFSLAGIILVSNNQDSKTLHATFSGVEDGVYYFQDENDSKHLFQEVHEDALKKYDLSSETFKGKTFKITYTVKTDLGEINEEDELGDDIEIHHILDLELLE